MAGNSLGRKKLELTGQRFGMLTVLRPTENINGRTAWWCRCDCGTELAVRTGYLRNGHATHCGCQYESPSGTPEKQSCRIDLHERRADLSEARFGALTVLSPAEKINGYLAWRCRCDCGKELVVRTECLKRGKTTSCGCKSPHQYDFHKLDLTGQTFGKLLVLHPAEKNSSTAWWCRCACGREIVTATDVLRRGLVRSCGCDAPPPERGENYGFAAVLHLVDGTCVETLRSKKLRRNNTSGVTGVYWRSSTQSRCADINFKRHRYYLGTFKRFEDAVKARKQGKEEYHDAFLREFDRMQQAKTAEPV